MLQYPSILGIKKMPLGLPCVAFYKYDGSNMRFEWSPKKGWHKYGSRTQIIDSSHEMLGSSIEIFQDIMAASILEKVKERDPKGFKNLERLTAFAEFYGENSFAGFHDPQDEKTLTLFDLFMFKEGFLPPKDFIKTFKDTPYAAEVLYEGNLNQPFIEHVRKNESNKLFEGVICKGYNPHAKKGKELWMTKIKTLAYLDKLKNKYEGDWEKYGE